ncbi:BscS [Raoultella ornithinolytica]|nr:BscS [Raoultella ornithinolytica]
MESLQKVLLVDANNTQAMYLMALWAQQGGDLQAAAQWRARLAKVSPESPNLQELDNAKKMAQVPQGQLSLARQQARSGQYSGCADDLAQYVQRQHPATGAGR